MRLTRSHSEGQRMVITTSQCLEHRSYGASILNDKSTRWTWQSVWHWSSYHGSWKLKQFVILGWISALMQPSAGNSQSKIGTIWMLSRSPKGTWCDYCKMRWTVSDYRGQTQAVWQIVSKRHGKVHIRNYCHSCAMEVQGWPDGSLFTLNEQIQYAKGVQKLDVQFE